MDKNFFVRLESNDEISKFVRAWQRDGFLALKKDRETRGLSIKDMMVADGGWKAFFEEYRSDGEDPEIAVEELEELVRNVL